jgi:hypothetical protein
MELMITVPVSLLAPMTALFYVSNVAEKLEISENFLEYGFSPAVFKLLTTTHLDKLRDI